MTPTRLMSARKVGVEALRFGAAGIVASVADLALFWVLVTGAGLSPLAANPVSVVVRLAVAFWLTRTWVFPDRRERTLLAEAAGFLVLAGLNLAGVQAALWVTVHAAGGSLSPEAATAVKVAAIAATFTLRFVLSRRVVFRADQVR